MEPKDFDSFEDNKLKDAIRRAWKDDAAPPELIERVRNASSLSSSRAGDRTRIVVWRSALAAAAVILISLAIIGYRTHGVAPRATVAAAALPKPLAEDLVERHDECCSHEDHHMPGIPRDDYAAIASVLAARLGWPVLAASIGNDWSFKGASICPVGSQESAHLVFKRGNDDVSVFSLPAWVVPAADQNKSFDQTQTGHPIASFISGRGLFCIVCSSPNGSMTLDNANAIRSELRRQLQTQVAEAAERITVAGR
jgi:hypothetical protein